MSAETNRGPLLLSLALGVLALGAVGMLLASPVTHVLSQPSPSGYDVERMVLLYSTLPRLVMALLCGAGLAVSGAILQQVLRNPLASPTTLGIDAGARLAVTLVTLFIPALLGLGRDLVALFGSAITTLLVFALVRRRHFSALSIVLAGLVVSLYCGAVSALLILVKDRVLTSLFIWGGGSLSQQSWEPSLALAWRLGLLVVPAVLLVRPLSLLDLDDDSARALGVRVSRLRMAAVAIAAALAAFVTSAVGVIGFIGLVAPIVARLSGARLFGARLLWSGVIGALLLLLTDATLQNAAGVMSDFVPTGAVTAVLGTPLLLMLLPRLRAAVPPPVFVPTPGSSRGAGRTAAVVAVTLLVVAIAMSLLVGRAPSGEWQLLSFERLDDVMRWRLPRLGAAACAGALLGTAGLVLQRLTGNPMASPEVIGVSAGSILAVAVSLFVFGSVGGAGMGVSAALGGAGVLAVILALGRRSGFAPERVLLAGIALNALIDAVVGVLSATGDPRAILLLGWMSGSTNGTTPEDAMRAGMAAAVLVAASLLVVRWLAILPLGSAQALALGVPLARARFVLLLLAAASTAAATPIVGPLTFVGLMAPHLVARTGIRRPLPALVGSAIAGAGVLAIADLTARTVAFPLQLPTGLVAAMIGAPFLMVLLNRRSG